MSLQNLGKVTRALAKATDSKGRVSSKFAAELMKASGLSLGDAVAALKSNKTNKKLAEDILVAMGFDEKEIGKSLTSVFADSTTIIDNLSDTYTGFKKKLKDTGKGIGESLSKMGSSLLSFATSPAGVGTIALLTTLGVGLVALKQEYDKSFDGLTEKYSALSSATEETESTIASLTSNIESNSAKIQELKDSGATSGTSKELKKLEQENALYESQLTLQKNLLKFREEAEAAASKQTLGSAYDSYVYAESAPHYDMFTDAVYPNAIILDRTLEESYAADIKQLDQLSKSYDEVAANAKTYESELDGLTAGTDEFKSKSQELNQATKDMQGYAQEMAELEESITDKRSQLAERYSSFFRSDGSIISGYENEVARLENLIPEMTGLNEKTKEISDAYKNTLENSSKDGAADLNLLNNMNSWLRDLSSEDQELVYKIFLEDGNAVSSLSDIQAKLEKVKSELGLTGTPFSLDMEAQRAGIEAVTTAMSESASATGLASSSVKALTDRYKDLEGFNSAALFNNTATGIKLNATELARLEKAYEAAQRLGIANSMADLIDRYDELTESIKEHAGTALEDDYRAQRAAIVEDIKTLRILQAEYDGLTNSYVEWVTAQSATQYGAWFDTAMSSLDALNTTYKNGEYGNTALQEGLEFFTGRDITGIEDWREQMTAIDSAYAQLSQRIDGTSYSLNDFMKSGKTGCNNFLKAVQQLGNGWATFDAATNSWTFSDNFNPDNAEAIAKEFGTSAEFIEMMMDSLSRYGFKFNTEASKTDIQEIDDEIALLKQTVDSLNSEDISIDTKVTGQIDVLDKLQDKIKQINESDATPEVKEQQLQDVYKMIDDVVSNMNQPSFMNIDTSQLEGSLGESISLLQDYQRASNNLKATELKGLGSTEISAASAEVDNIVNKIAALPKDQLVSLGFELEGIEDANIADVIKAQISTLQITLPSLNGENGEGVSATVNYELGTQAPPVDQTATVNYDLGKVAKPPDATVKVHYTIGNVDKPGSVVGDHYAGVSGYSLASGTAALNGKIKGAPGGRTLMGELGEEIYVDPSTNRWQTVGTNGAEFVNLPKNAIVFNHMQTRNLLYHGKVSSRGRAMASGNAAVSAVRSLTSGNVNVRGTPAGYVRVEIVETPGTSTKTDQEIRQELADSLGDILTNGLDSDSVNAEALRQYADDLFNTHTPMENTSVGGGPGNRQNKPGSGSGDGGGGGASDDASGERYDWIEVLVERIERSIDNLATITESSYKALMTRLGASDDQISKITEEIGIQEKAYDRYIEEANSIELSDDLKALVQTGAIDINRYDEETQKKIEEYKEYYDKALAASDAVLELRENLAELYEANFEMIQTDYENQLDIFEHQITSYENRIEELEELGYLASTQTYTALQEATKNNVDVLTKELASLNDYFNKAMESGEIEEGSESWYSMRLAIMDVQEQIDEANLSLIEYAATIRELEWEYFDFAQSRIEQLTKESDFLISLLENSDLFSENGKLTNNGMATIGLHGMNYNVLMAQADQYSKELLKINDELANDPNNKNLIERREELLDLQHDSILAAEDEKQAIIELIEEGIEAELDSLQELIDKYTDALDSAKDLYDYQKKIQDHTSEISSLQKQLMAYENDESEETRATIQKLKVSLEEAKEDLEETEYDQYIDDQKKLLDELYVEYEEILNQRIDELEASFDEVVGTINENSDLINETIASTAADVGYTLTEGMQTIWDSSSESIESVISTYGDGFNEKLTSVNKVLSEINHYVSKMVASSDAHVTGEPPAFASGGLADFTGLAQLDGTPQKPELVLDAQDTKNFLELTEILRTLSSQELRVGDPYDINVGNVSHVPGLVDISSVLASIRNQPAGKLSNSFGDINITIPIDHVDGYNDFVNQLRDDQKFERMIQDMTIGRLSNGSRLSKNKYGW